MMRRRMLSCVLILGVCGPLGCSDELRLGSRDDQEEKEEQEARVPSPFDGRDSPGVEPRVTGDEIVDPMQDGAGPPLGSGAVLVAGEDSRAVVAPPGSDRVYVVDLNRGEVAGSIEIGAGAEPGAMVEDDAGRVHMISRRTGELVRLDIWNNKVLGRTKVCSRPRGVDFDEATGACWVACAGGELVKVGAGDGAVEGLWRLDPDLRDVVVMDEAIMVSRFRAAEILAVKRTGEVVERHDLDPTDGYDAEDYEGRVAWKMRREAGSRRTVVVVHQEHSKRSIRVSAGATYYSTSSTCSSSSLVRAVMTRIDVGPGEREERETVCMRGAQLPVDVASSVDRSTGKRRITIVSGVSITSRTTERTRSRVHTVVEDEYSGWDLEDDPLVEAEAGNFAAASYTRGGTLVALSLEPTTLHLVPAEGQRRSIGLQGPGGQPPTSWGRRLFHMDSGRGITCASCHPEGLDDGHTWLFRFKDGYDWVDRPRRTQGLRGGLVAPFHWEGDMDSFDALMEEVFVGRMNGPELTEREVDAMQGWLDGLTTQHQKVSSPAIARGAALFVDARTGCASCHTGEGVGGLFDVGTGGLFKAPALVGLAERAPFMHDGCAETLEQRFVDPDCGGYSHGRTGHLSPSQIQDLVAYLETL